MTKRKQEEIIMIGTKFYEEYLNDNLLDRFRYHKEPACFNGMCHIKKYKVSIELIPETKEELLNRAISMYLSEEVSKNHYNKETLLNWVKIHLNIDYTKFKELVELRGKE